MPIFVPSFAGASKSIGDKLSPLIWGSLRKGPISPSSCLLTHCHFKLQHFSSTPICKRKISQLNNMTTNLPAKMAMAMVVLAAAMLEMVVVGSQRRVWIGRWSQLLQCNDATNPQQNWRWRSFVIPTAAAMDCPVAMLDNWGASKMTNTTNVRPWQQSKGTREYNNGGNDGPPSSPANREDKVLCPWK